MRLLEWSLLDESKTDLVLNEISTEELKNLTKTIELHDREQLAFLEGQDLS
jgi:hypothetical protein